MLKNSPANAGDTGLISGWGRSPGVGNSNPIQYSCLGNPTDRGALRATVHGPAKESDTTEHTHMYMHSYFTNSTVPSLNFRGLLLDGSLGLLHATIAAIMRSICSNLSSLHMITSTLWPRAYGFIFVVVRYLTPC